MTAYEAAVQEKDQLYARIQLVREEIKQEQDPGRRGEQKHRLRILFEMYHESLERLEALRPPQEKRHKAVKRTVIHTGAAGADVNSFDFFERCDLTFADLEGNQVRWDDLGSDNGESRARLMRALRRGRAAVSDRQREMLDLLLQGKTATEIAEQLDVNKATVSRTLLRAKKVLNDKAEDLRQEDLREHPNRLDLAEPETARYVLSRLTETQAVYLYLYYGEWLDMRSIGALLGVDHSTVCRTNHRAAGRIRALCTDGSGVELLGVDALEDGGHWRRANLQVHLLPFLTQADYDRLLWCCDFNAVRGEDSFVRAQWAGRPLLWHIYQQEEGAHWEKLGAFLDSYCAALTDQAASALRALWSAWNGKGDMAQAWQGLAEHGEQLAAHAEHWCQEQASRPDLAAALVQFHRNWLSCAA